MKVEDARRRPGWKVRVLGTVVMLLAALGVLELSSYVYLRAYEGYDGQHLMNYEFDDYKIIHPTPGYVNTKGVFHNAQGFRRKQEVSQVKPEGVYRIFLMGGSTGYGVGGMTGAGRSKYPILTNEQTIDYYLEGYLKNKVPGLKIEVINAAITSHQSNHHLIYLNQVILRYKPDMVVFLDGFNDYYPYLEGYDQFRDYAYQERAHLFMGEPTIRAWVGYTGWWLFRKSHFAHTLGIAVRPLWVSLTVGGAPRARIDVAGALENLKVNAERNFLRMVERNALILKAEGVASVFALQPEIFFEQDKRFTALEKEIFEELSQQWQENLVEYKRKARPIVLSGLRSVVSRAGGELVDLTNPFGGIEEDVYTDYCHLTPIGNQRLAEVLGLRIVPIIEVGRGVQAAHS